SLQHSHAPAHCMHHACAIVHTQILAGQTKSLPLISPNLLVNLEAHTHTDSTTHTHTHTHTPILPFMCKYGHTHSALFKHTQQPKTHYIHTPTHTHQHNHNTPTTPQ